MPLVTERIPLTARVLGCDTDTKLSQALAASFAGAGLAFVRRYLTLGGVPSSYDLDVPEVEDVTSQGLALMTQQHARSGGWSEALGATDGQDAARHHLEVVPAATTMGLDLEGPFVSKAQSIDYANAWYEAAKREGCTSLDVYIGAGVLLSSDELRRELLFPLYWKSASEVPDVAVRGYAMLQLSPLDTLAIGGAAVDLDVAQSDHLGNRHVWTRQG